MKSQLPAGSVLALYDVVNVLGVGEDLSHINTAVKLESYLGDMKNADTEAVHKALKDADVVIIPAGVPRKPGMTRDDLFNINAGIVRDLLRVIAKECPKALIAIITNPVNSTVPAAAEVLKAAGVYDPKRLFGVSTLDIVRAQTFIGELKGLDASKVKVDVIGGHSAETMLPVLSAVEGVTFTQEEQDALNKKIRDAGTAVVEAKAGAGSATLSMAYAGARFAMALVNGLAGKESTECTYIQVDNAETSFMAVPVVLGKNGVERILERPKLSEYEDKLWKEMIPQLEKNIQTGLEFGRKQ
eukprot:TRINITY_DN22123_c0_g1_i1.p1 TRINITY_DN22123_c0_g1~~TRINITY_DN22123_c0_g1_i1.p1  ORF type:complete len:326 (+),score=123.93 TRINITY_DN22123_c0_g1_i1:80-979(+)